MRTWISTGISEWWVDRDPPAGYNSARETVIREVRCSNTVEAASLVRQWSLGRDGAFVDELISRELRCAALHRMSRQDRERKLAQLIASNTLRVFRWSPVLRAGKGSATRKRTTLSDFRTVPRSDGRSYVRPAPRSSARPPLVPDVPPTLFPYQFILQDELGDGIEGVVVSMATPAGTRALVTDGAGSVRVEQAPAGEGSAAIDRDSLDTALEKRSARPRRSSPLPDVSARFEIVTPSRAGRTFTFPHAQPHTVMVVSRTDVVVIGADDRWQDLSLASESEQACCFVAGDLPQLHLCSRGSGDAGQLDGAPALNITPPHDSSAALARASATKGKYVVKPGDSLWAIAGKLFGNVMRWPELRDANAALFANRSPNLILVGEVLNVPAAPALGLIPAPGPWPIADDEAPAPFLTVSVDPLHEALFDRQGQGVFDSITSPFVPVSSPPEPFFDPPQAAADAAAILAGIVAVEQGVTPEELFTPIIIEEFDPVEHSNPRPTVLPG